MFASLDEEFGFKPPSGVGACTLSNSPDGMGDSMIQDRIKGLSWKEIADKYQLGSPGAARTKFQKLTGITDFKIKGQDLKALVDNNLLDQLKGAVEKKAKKAVAEVDDALKVAQAEAQAGEQGVQAVSKSFAEVMHQEAYEGALDSLTAKLDHYGESLIDSVTNMLDGGKGYMHIKSLTNLDFKQIDDIAWDHILIKNKGNVWDAYLEKPTSENGFNAVKGAWHDLKSKGLSDSEVMKALDMDDFYKEVGDMINDGTWKMPSMGSKTPIISKPKVSTPTYSGYSNPPPAPPQQNVVHYTDPKAASGGFQPRAETEYIDWTTKLGKDMTAEQLQAVQAYTGSAYHGINTGLRGGSATGGYVSHIDQVFKEIPFDTRVYRHVGSEAFKGDLKALGGKVYTDPGYLSTAIKDGGFGASRPVKMVIDVPKGTKARYVDVISLNKGEKEMILPRGTKMLVTKIEQKAGGQWIIHLTVMASA